MSCGTPGQSEVPQKDEHQLHNENIWRDLGKRYSQCRQNPFDQENNRWSTEAPILRTLMIQRFQLTQPRDWFTDHYMLNQEIGILMPYESRNIQMIRVCTAYYNTLQERKCAVRHVDTNVTTSVGKTT